MLALIAIQEHVMKPIKRNYIFDFDSTLTKVEALDVLAEITLKDNPNKAEIIQEIIDITNLGIDGDISFTESLERRIKLLKAKKSDLAGLIEALRQQVSISIENNKAFFENFSNDIYVISAGFKEFIIPIVAEYNIDKTRVYANTFEFDENDVIVGFDRSNPLSVHNGKIQCLRDMKLEGEIQVIGDGYSDAVTRKAGVADKFFAYTENITRDKTTQNADFIAPSLDEFLFVNKLPRSISYPKNRITVLLFDDVHSEVHHSFRNDGFNVETVAVNSSEDELIYKSVNAHVVILNSEIIPDSIISKAEKLLVVGVLTDAKLVNTKLCKEKGIVVFHDNNETILTNSILNFINTGNSSNAINFPSINLPEYKDTHRFLHIHENKPGVMARINEILANSRRNIMAQYLSTDSKIGYVMTDIDKKYSEELINELKTVDGTIKFRVLY